jgi:predicted nucleic acid-binding protein
VPESKKLLVLDTQVWLDWLVFDDPSVEGLREAVEAGRAEIVIDAPCEAELERVLAYDLGKHSITPVAQAAALAQARRLSFRTEMTLSLEARKGLPRCSDPDDQKFLELAASAGAHMLVTKDRALLELARRKQRPPPFKIVRPEKF